MIHHLYYTCIAEGDEHLIGADLGRRVDFFNRINDLGRGEEVGGFGRGRCRAVGGLKGGDVDRNLHSLRGEGRLIIVAFHYCMH